MQLTGSVRQVTILLTGPGRNPFILALGRWGMLIVEPWFILHKLANISL